MANEMRDRLVELILQGDKKCGESDCNSCKHRESAACGFSVIADHLIENGVVVPPCKVGDKVYFIDTCTTAEDFGKQYVSWGEVLQLSFNCFGGWVVLTNKKLLDMGEAVFLTKAEAEQKLK